jgi:5,10-methylenetetrahydrofolate reductase
MDFSQLIKEEEFLYIVELEPPKGHSLDELMGNIQDLSADAFNIVDSPLGTPLMNPVALSHNIQSGMGTPAIMHFTCRDRNLIEIKADLLAARALEVKNILALTGDKVPKGSKAKGVFEFSSVGLIKFIKDMNSKMETDFFVGCAADLNSNLDTEIKRTKEKIEAGAEFVMTQPCYDIEKIKTFIGAIDRPVIIGMLTFYSKEEAEKFNGMIPGMFPMESFQEDMNQFYGKLINEIRESGAKGVNIMPFGKFTNARKLIQG